MNDTSQEHLTSEQAWQHMNEHGRALSELEPLGRTFEDEVVLHAWRREHRDLRNTHAVLKEEEVTRQLAQDLKGLPRVN